MQTGRVCRTRMRVCHARYWHEKYRGEAEESWLFSNSAKFKSRLRAINLFAASAAPLVRESLAWLSVSKYMVSEK